MHAIQNRRNIGIVIPCYNEEDVIEKTYTTLKELRKSDNLNLFFIFVNDGSIDDTFSILRSVTVDDEQSVIIDLSRNFGHQNAVLAGLSQIEDYFEAMVIIDADLQDPPELIPEMVKKWEAGVDVVYGQRVKRAGESFFKKSSAFVFYRILNLFANPTIPQDVGDFRLISARVVRELLNMPEQMLFIRGMVSFCGYPQVPIEYERNERSAGKTKYSINEMLSLASKAVISFSIKPLRFAIVSAVALSILAVTGIVYVLYMRLLTDNWVPGWSAVMIAILIIGAMQLFSIGIIGEYIAHIHQQSKCRPRYIIKDIIGTISK